MDFISGNFEAIVFYAFAAMIVFVSGFNGLLTWKHGMALGVEGLVILSLWRDPGNEAEWGVPVSDANRTHVPEYVAGLAVGGSLALALLGGWLAVLGSLGMTHLKPNVSPGAMAASLLSLVLATPIVQSGRHLAMAGASWIPMTAQVGIVLLNLCVLLPLLAVAPYIQSIYHAFRWTARPHIDWDAVTIQATIFPLAVWRIDTVVLILLSTLLLPVAAGKWNLGKEEGVLLIAGYCIYLLGVTVAGI